MSMDVKAYNEFSMAQRDNRPFVIPMDLLLDGEFDTDYLLSELSRLKYITYTENGNIELSDMLARDLPEVYELLTIVIRDRRQAQMDEMIDKGLVTMGLREDGEIIYSYTALGAAYINALKDNA